MNWQQLDELPAGVFVEGEKNYVWLTFWKLPDGTWKEMESNQVWTKYEVAALNHVDRVK